jgi:hypothetical protein
MLIADVYAEIMQMKYNLQPIVNIQRAQVTKTCMPIQKFLKQK